MEKIPYETILDISRKVNIVDVIADYLPLTKRGKNYFAICPFHDDHNPSMSISEEKQIYTCFVCGASGNVFNFVMNYEKISFIEAVNKVARKAGIFLDIKTKSNTSSFDDKNNKYYEMFLLACKYYKNNIKTKYGINAIKYLHDRNLSDEVIDNFEIGLSMNGNEVSKLLEKKGFKKEDFVNIGLSGSKDNFCYDIFRNRIMFPLYDTLGHVVGFSGRIYNGEDESKYVNSKESVIFKKGSLLYNYHRAITHAKEKNEIIIVEGFMDVIRLYTIGIKNVVATMGTAITREHALLIRRLSSNVILLFDGDKAGNKATLSAIEELEKINITPRVIRLEEDLDPDDYIIKKGIDKFNTHYNNAMSSIEYKISLDKEKTNFNDFNEVSSYLKSVSKELEKIDDRVVYELTVKKLAKQTGVDIETINDLVKNIPKEKINIIDKRKTVNKDKFVKAEEYLIYYMLKNKEAIKIYEEKISYLTNEKLSKIADKILAFYDENHYINITDFVLYLEDEDDLIKEVLKIDELSLPDSMNEEQINDYIKTIDKGLLKKEINNLKDKIRREVDTSKKIILLQKLTELKKRECK